METKRTWMRGRGKKAKWKIWGNGAFLLISVTHPPWGWRCWGRDSPPCPPSRPDRSARRTWAAADRWAGARSSPSRLPTRLAVGGPGQGGGVEEKILLLFLLLFYFCFVHIVFLMLFCSLLFNCTSYCLLVLLFLVVSCWLVVVYELLLLLMFFLLLR